MTALTSVQIDNSLVSKTVVGRQFIHSCYANAETKDVVIVKEIVFYSDGTTEPTLRFINNPTRRFWITKPGARTYTDKKEWEKQSNLDVYTSTQRDLANNVFKALKGFYPSRPARLRDVCDSPYVYGADIDIEVLIKDKYRKDFEKTKLVPKPATTGFMDAEWSVLQGDKGRVLMVTITHETQVYTAIVKDKLFTVDSEGNHIPATLEDLAKLSAEILKEYNDKYGFTYTYYAANDEVDLYRWIFARIHENKTDFMGTWNIKADVNDAVVEMCKRNNLDPEEFFCPPEIPKEFRFFKFEVDTNQKCPHFSRRWHFARTPSYTQFYDAMCLYSILRTVKGYEKSYKLDHILKVNGFGGKLKFTNLPNMEQMIAVAWHRAMQSKFPLEYCVYNQYDAISLQMMEKKNTDVQSMYNLIGRSHLSNYIRQTRRGADDVYYNCLEAGKVICSPGSSMRTEYDDIIGATGGAVIRPERTYNLGLRIFRDAPHIVSGLSPATNDVDFAGMYPAVNIGANVSRETKVSSAIGLIGFSKHDTLMYHSMLVSIRENAVFIGKQYYGLPGYEEMYNRYKAAYRPVVV